ncbi:MAG: flagellar filament capping protein FliD [Gallionella sp.]|jgi:flagellar hook-associated protein 2
MVTTATTATSSAATGAINVVSIVSTLMTVASIPVNTLSAKQASYQSKISAYGTVQSQMTALQTAAAALGSTTASSLQAYKATPSDTTVFTATADSTAVAGNYALNVTSLAQSQNLVAAGKTSTTTAISNGVATTVSFDLGTITGGTLAGGVYTGATYTSGGAGIKSIVIDSTNNTLAGIRDAINAGGLGVTATIINDGSAAPNRLTLTSNATGVNQSVKITTAGGDGTINTLLGYDPAAVQNMNQTVAAQNANFTVNGIAVTSTSNTSTTAIQGVSLNLSKITTAPVSLTVARDTTAITTAVTNFVNAYNTMYSSMQTASAYKSISPLAGEATIRDTMNQMRNIAAGAVTGGTMSSIGQAGISFTAAGVMQLDSTKLNTAMSTDFTGLSNLFNNSTTGYATLFHNLATDVLSSTGTFASRTNSLNQSVKTAGDRINVMNSQLAALQMQYTRQYSALNVLMANMNQTSTYLTQQLSRL